MRLEFQNTCKIHDRKKQTYDLLDVNTIFPVDRNVAILATQQRSSKALTQLIAGIEAPTRGKIIREGSFSSLIGESGYFHRELSGEQNIRFIAKLYGQNQNQLIEKIKDFAELTNELKQKAKNYSSPLRRKITLSTSLLMELDLYQIDGPIKKNPQAKFNRNVQQRLKQISQQARLVIASDDKQFLRKHAHSAFIINNEGRLIFCDDLETGIAKYNQLKKDNKSNAVE